MSLIAGSVDVHEVIDKLRAPRPVFHSEADVQHAFAWALHQTQPALNIRLEVRQHPDDSAEQQGSREHVDLYCFGPHGHTFLEFKYFTAKWDGTDPTTGEQFRLRAHRDRPGTARLRVRHRPSGTLLHSQARSKRVRDHADQ